MWTFGPLHDRHLCYDARDAVASNKLKVSLFNGSEYRPDGHYALFWVVDLAKICFVLNFIAKVISD